MSSPEGTADFSQCPAYPLPGNTNLCEKNGDCFALIELEFQLRNNPTFPQEMRISQSEASNYVDSLEKRGCLCAEKLKMLITEFPEDPEVKDTAISS